MLPRCDREATGRRGLAECGAVKAMTISLACGFHERLQDRAAL
jgi:hypothetical protein